MHRWVNCPGSVKLSEGVEVKTSPYAEEGTKAHELAAALLSETEWKDDQKHDKEFFESVAVYVDLITEEAINNRHGQYGIETQFHIPEFHPQFYGTCDAWAYCSKQKLLRVYDFKYGKGHRVEVENNPQLLYYLTGIYLLHGFDADKFECVIVQPRMPNRLGQVVHRWGFSSVEPLLDFSAEFFEAVEKAEGKNPPLKAGNYCYFCPARLKCPEQRKKRFEKARQSFLDDPIEN